MNCYIHVPFCSSKCGYCAFYSDKPTNEKIIDDYLTNLELEVSKISSSISTLYIGGGTPTLLSVKQLEKLFSIIKSLQFNDNAEISIESNPETLTLEKVKLLRNNVTRLSMGVQSFNEKLRSSLGRKCNSSSLKNALTLIKEAKFPHFNLDLIYGIPGETMEDFIFDIKAALSWGVDHLSCYSLTPEETSILGNSYQLDEDMAAKMYEAIPNLLLDADIFQYEISNYAKVGCECQHNVNVWQGQLLLGIGPSAAGFDGINRYSYECDINKWNNRNAIKEIDEIPLNHRLAEIFAVNLRTVKGWNKKMWSQVPNCDTWENRLTIARDICKKYPKFWDIKEDNIKLTKLGRLYWDTIAEELLP